MLELKKQLDILLEKLDQQSDPTSRRNHQEIRQISSKLDSDLNEDDLRLLELKLSQIFSRRASEICDNQIVPPSDFGFEDRKKSQLSQGS